MYLTAHRVRSPRGATGVNVALYLHAGTELPANVWTLPTSELLATITAQYPGRRETSRVEVAPGGNSVESFLDLVAPDGTPIAELEVALNELRPRAIQSRRVQLRMGNVCAEFSVNLGSLDVAGTFDELANAALTLSRQPTPPPWQDLVPLRIDATHDADGWHFVLSEEGAARVRGAGGQPARVHVRHETAAAFRELYGELYPWVAQWVTNLTRERLLELGGTRIVSDGQIVDEWPERREETARAL